MRPCSAEQCSRILCGKRKFGKLWQHSQEIPFSSRNLGAALTISKIYEELNRAAGSFIQQFKRMILELIYGNLAKVDNGRLSNNNLITEK